MCYVTNKSNASDIIAGLQSRLVHVGLSDDLNSVEQPIGELSPAANRKQCLDCRKRVNANVLSIQSSCSLANINPVFLPKLLIFKIYFNPKLS